jgi:uncharacterized protein (DUF1501 family)
MGAWMSYGLGCETDDLPAFVVMTSSDKGKTCGQLFFDYYWGSGFLPSRFQGVKFRNTGDPVPYLANPAGVSAAARRALLDDLAAMNAKHLADYGDPEIDTRIAQYEMAYRMQTSVPELMDIASEPAAVHEAYGTQPGKAAFSNNCLLARRLIERGVRFVQLYHWGWDSHGDIKENDIRYGMVDRCRETDRPAAALVKDLKQRGLLEHTLVIWGGEFGRTPMNEARNKDGWLGRDHHPHAFTIWMAGGGVKPGITYGATDELGYRAAENPVHVHDLQATILQLLGLEHTKLTFRFQGRDYRLTDVEGDVVKGLLA